MTLQHVAIVGAGIAGLTAALSFAKRGVKVDIFEQADTLSEVGAGLQLSPNATHILSKLGLLDTLAAHWTEPESINLASALSLRNVVELPISQVARERWHSPYGVLHRATLQNTLKEAALSSPHCHIHFDSRIESDPLQFVTKALGKTPDLLVGADGVWSKVRSALDTNAQARFSGTIALRFTINAAPAEHILQKDAVTAFMGPGAHLVAYPLKEINGFNLVLLGDGKIFGTGWNEETSVSIRRDFDHKMSKWHPALRNIINSIENPKCWPLYEVKLDQWHNGRDLVLIGDAAHAMTPFAAQGAALAIEDAYLLAKLTSGATDLPNALNAFQQQRVPRVERARKRAGINKFAYHARGPIAQARDLVMALRPEKAFLADFDWLYGFRPE